MVDHHQKASNLKPHTPPRKSAAHRLHRRLPFLEGARVFGISFRCTWRWRFQLVLALPLGCSLIMTHT